MWIFLPYFRPDRKIDTLFQTRPYPGTDSVCVKIWGGLQIGMVNIKDHKSNFFQELYIFADRDWVTEPYPISNQNQHRSKTIPFGAANTEWLPPRGKDLHFPSCSTATVEGERPCTNYQYGRDTYPAFDSLKRDRKSLWKWWPRDFFVLNLSNLPPRCDRNCISPSFLQDFISKRKREWKTEIRGINLLSFYAWITTERLILLADQLCLQLPGP